MYITSLYTDASRASHADHRLVVIGWKTPQKEVGNSAYRKPPTICISIPRLQLTCEPLVLREAMQEALNDMQNAMLRDTISAKSVEQRIGLSFTDADLDANAVRAFMAGSSGSSNGRLSGEKIASWFDSSVTDQLTLLLAEKMQLSNEPSSEQLLRLNAALDQRRTLLTKIAGPGVPFNAMISEQLLRSVEPAEDSLTKQQVVAKLRSYISKGAELENLL